MKEEDGTRMMRRRWKELGWERAVVVLQCLEGDTEHVKERIIKLK